jgi:hypothetical protein
VKDETVSTIRTPIALLAALPTSFLNVVATAHSALLVAFFSSLKKKH